MQLVVMCLLLSYNQHFRSDVMLQPGLQSEPTFLFGSTGQRVLVLLLPRHPAVLHPTEEGSPSSGGQVGRPDGGVHLDLNTSCTQKDSIRGDDT